MAEKVDHVRGVALDARHPRVCPVGEGTARVHVEFFGEVATYNAGEGGVGGGGGEGAAVV